MIQSHNRSALKLMLETELSDNAILLALLYIAQEVRGPHFLSVFLVKHPGIPHILCSSVSLLCERLY